MGERLESDYSLTEIGSATKLENRINLIPKNFIIVCSVDLEHEELKKDTSYSLQHEYGCISTTETERLQ